jgi:DeoR/GlpR family transcriptional regulator of sugar metabolism
MGLELPRIEISSKHKQELADKYKVSRVAIRSALNYFSNSDQAKKIREDAIAILKNQVETAEKLTA